MKTLFRSILTTFLLLFLMGALVMITTQCRHAPTDSEVNEEITFSDTTECITTPDTTPITSQPISDSEIPTTEAPDTECTHRYSAKTQGATCTEEGRIVYTCSSCGDTYHKVIPVRGHTEKTVITAATCSEKGSTITSCSVCGIVIKSETIAAKGHSTQTTTTATCTTAGKKITACTVCGTVTKTVTVNATGHNYNYANGSCSSCGTTIPYTKQNGTNKFTTIHHSHYANMSLTMAQNLPSGWGGTQYFLDGSVPYTWFITYSDVKWVNEIMVYHTGATTPYASDLSGIGVYYSNSDSGWAKINSTVKVSGNYWVFVFSQAVQAKNFMLHMASPSNRIHCNWLENHFYGVYDPQSGNNDAAYTYNGPASVEKIKIYVDQGHNMSGYHNAGAQGNGLDEGRVTYNVGILLKNLLEADGRFEVKLSRPTESTVLGTDNSSSLRARYQGANNWGADYFVSLHCNAASAAAHGIEVLTYSASGTAYDFGNRMLNALCAATGWRNRGMKVRPELAVLNGTSMPAALIEMGFITNPTEAALMGSNPGFIAQAIYSGILSYFGYTA